jgi:TetR/AcrR family transcriptional regulator
VESRERLAATALDLFVERGYDAVGVQEIVGTAGLTKPTLYHHYGNKRGLLRELAREVEERLFAVAGDAFVYRRDMPRDLERLVAALLAFARTHPQAARLLLAAQNGPAESDAREALAPVWTRLSDEIESFFVSASAEHGNMRGREREYTVSLLGVVFAYVVLQLDGRLPERPNRAHEIMRQFSYGIYS